MADRIRSLPPLPVQPGDVAARLDALEARNALLVETLVNFCQAWQMLRGEYPPEVDEIIRACRAA